MNNNSLYEISFNKSNISAKFVAILKNLPSEITSFIMHPNKRFVFVSTNTSGVYIYRLSPFRVYKSLVNDGNNIYSDMNNNYATLLTDSNHIFTSHSILFDLTTGSSKKVIPSNVYFLNLGLDSSKNIWLPTGSVVSRFYIQEPGKINRYPIKDGDVPRTFYLAKNGNFWVSTSRFLGYEDHKRVRELISYGNDDSSSFLYLAEAMDARLVGANQRGIFLIIR